MDPPSPSIPETAASFPGAEVSPVESKDSAAGISSAHSNVGGITDEIPESVGTIGELTAKLSQVSIQKEKEQEQSQSKGKFATFVRRVRPMIQGKFMAFLAISNLILFIFIVLAVITLIVLGGFSLHKYLQYKGLKDMQSQDQCAVIYDQWSECSGECTNREEKQLKAEPKLPTRTRKMIAVYGNCDPKIGDDEIYCNLFSCNPSNSDASRKNE